MDLINKALLLCEESFFCSLWDPRMANENDSRGAFRSAVLRWCWEASSTVIPLLHFPTLPWKPSTNHESCSAAHQSAYSITCVIALIIESFLLYLNGIVPLLIQYSSSISAAGKVHPGSTRIRAFIPELAGTPSCPMNCYLPPPPSPPCGFPSPFLLPILRSSVTFHCPFQKGRLKNICCVPVLPRLHDAAPITPFLSHGRTLFITPRTVIAFLTMGTLFITYYNPKAFSYNNVS